MEEKKIRKKEKNMKTIKKKQCKKYEMFLTILWSKKYLMC